MTCSLCQATDLAPDTGVQVCWCREDVCAGCLDKHILTCEWFRKGVSKPEEKPKKKMSWPKVEHGGAR
jgi:hypothetical protein